MIFSRAITPALLLAITVFSLPVHATNGYFMIGYGPKSIAMGGVGIAYAQDQLAGSVNPAGYAALGDGMDVGIRNLFGFRDAELDCTGILGCDAAVKDRSNRDFFMIPNFGYSRSLNNRLRAGIAVYGNGGIVTSYGKPIFDETLARLNGLRPGDPGFPQDGKLGTDFSQLMIAPSLAFKATDEHHFGISAIFALQRITFTGLRGFAFLSTDPSSVSNRGTEYMLGGGFRVGWTSELKPGLRIGAQYTSKMQMGKSVEYNGLLRNNGEIDIPASFGFGVGWEITPALLVALDYQRLLYAEVAAIGNDGPTAAELTGAITPDRRLGGKDGIGFGWKNQDIVKLGARYHYSAKLTLRAGYNYGSSQLPEDQMLFNIISPATINHHLTLGASWALSDRNELSFSFMHAFSKTNRDPNTELFGISAKGRIMEHALDLSWSRHF